VSADDDAAFQTIVKGTLLKAPVGDVRRHSRRMQFSNSAGMLCDPSGVYGSTPILCDVDVFLAGPLALAVATMTGGSKKTPGRVTVGQGLTAEVEPALKALLMGSGTSSTRSSTPRRPRTNPR
jgi:hypothetical protein